MAPILIVVLLLKLLGNNMYRPHVVFDAYREKNLNCSLNFNRCTASEIYSQAVLSCINVYHILDNKLTSNDVSWC